MMINVSVDQGATAGELFTIASVAVDATAANAQKAQQAALAEGQQRALRLLLEKLTLESDRERLPRVAPDRVADFVQGFEVANERRSSRRYLAELTVRFKPDAVRALLRRHDIAFAETMSPPIVVLPIFNSDGTARLWADPNPWRDAWLRLERRQGLVDLVIPIGEASDVATIDSGRALAGDRAALHAIAAGHDAGEAMVAVARVTADAAGAPVVDVNAQRYGPVVGPWLVERFVGTAGATVEQTLAEAAAKLAARIEHDWKAANLLAFDEQREIVVAVPIESLDQWLGLRARLDTLPLIRRTDILTLSRHEALLRLHYLGEFRRLAGALAEQAVSLTVVDGRWTLAPLIEVGARAPAPAPDKGAAADGAASAPPEATVELPPIGPVDTGPPPPDESRPAPPDLDDLLVE